MISTCLNEIYYEDGNMFFHGQGNFVIYNIRNAINMYVTKRPLMSLKIENPDVINRLILYSSSPESVVYIIKVKIDL